MDVKMLVFEAKLKGTNEQYGKLDEAIRTARFVRNSCLRYWMDNRDIGRYELSAYCAVLAKEFEWADKLNSMARQASAERAWSAISRFYDNCKKSVDILKIGIGTLHEIYLRKDSVPWGTRER
jgi:putative transposase